MLIVEFSDIEGEFQLSYQEAINLKKTKSEIYDELNRKR